MKPVRYAQVDTIKKPLTKWLLQVVLAQLPYQRIADDECELRWTWRPHVPHRYEVNFGPPLLKGDHGYDDAEYETGLILSKDSFRRMTPEPNKP